MVEKKKDTKTTLHLLQRKRHEDYPASVACTSNRYRVVFMSFSFPLCFCSGVVFLCFHLGLVSILFIRSSLHLKIFRRKFLPLVLSSVGKSGLQSITIISLCLFSIPYLNCMHILGTIYMVVYAYRSTFALSWPLWMYSSNGIWGMFHCHSGMCSPANISGETHVDKRYWQNISTANNGDLHPHFLA